MKRIIFLLLTACAVCSCAAVKETHKVYINDPDMALSDKKVDRFETNFQAYREAAAGAKGAKAGGGCGCN